MAAAGGVGVAGEAAAAAAAAAAGGNTRKSGSGSGGDLSERINKIKDDLARSHSKGEVTKDGLAVTPEPPKKSENDIQWELLKKHLNRPLTLCDLDFNDLTAEDNSIVPVKKEEGVPPPPPPPPSLGGPPPPPPPFTVPPPPNMPPVPPAPPGPRPMSRSDTPAQNSQDTDDASSRHTKTKKTIKLFWKEVGQVRSGHVKKSHVLDYNYKEEKSFG